MMLQSPRLGALHAGQASRWVLAGHFICAPAHYARLFSYDICGVWAAAQRPPTAPRASSKCAAGSGPPRRR
ncbi:hypothetical protein HaLaN_09557 [Haematococcus lacustris]|uniref:Uncharacterized protein n=1 Tax=Haematococcus lacustris TaxID=44745 RepID=A0A699YV45_HAELA|nr:hypothetical protein HaLaN_09557 [Haematococcus lacustris]